MKQQFIKGTGDTFKTYFYENNRRITPSSARITIYKPASADKLVDDAAMSVEADGAVSYALTTTANGALGCDYKATISCVHDSRTLFATVFYDVVNSRLAAIIIDEDIVAELPQLKDNGWRVRGRSVSGSTTTLVDPELKRYEDASFTGGLIMSLDSGETREITGFASATGTVSTTAFSTAIATDRYVITRSYSKEIQRAFEKMEDALHRSGNRAHLVLDSYDLRETHIYYSVAEVCKGISARQGDLWWALWEVYEKKAIEAFGALNFKYDKTVDGYISTGEAGARTGTARTGRG